MELIRKAGFESYFHKVLDVLDLTQDIPHLTRGSAGSSLVCYLLGITDIDPVAENIDVARFMHQYRQDDPDIDIDFPHYLQSEVHSRIYKRWPGLAYRISNHVHYRDKSARNEAMRMLNKKTVDEEVKNLAIELKGKVRCISKHCGGVVIFDEPPEKECIISDTQISLDKREVEAKRLLKIDILSNRGLSQLVEISRTSILDYPEGDAKTSEMLSRGDSIGITQAESPAFRKMLRALKPRSRSDIILAMGLIRPAAASRGRKSAFFEAWDDNRQISNLVFEDDAIRKIAELANLPMDKADTYRKAFSKGNQVKIQEFSEMIKGQENYETIMGDLSQFREYSLCKAHGISYGRMVWALAYQKAHNPKAFWYSTLKHTSSMYRRWVHVQEAKLAGWNVIAGKEEPVIDGDTIIMNSQRSLLPPNGWEEYRKYGVWSSSRFFPQCYYEEKHGFVKCRGMIATGRRLRKEDGTVVTFITIGYDNGKYLDIVVDGTLEWWDLDMVHIQGEKKSLYRSEWVQVCRVTEKIKI